MSEWEEIEGIQERHTLLSFIVKKGSLREVGKAYRFVYKNEEYFVPKSQCKVDWEKNIIRIPDWIVNKNQIG